MRNTKVNLKDWKTYIQLLCIVFILFILITEIATPIYEIVRSFTNGSLYDKKSLDDLIESTQNFHAGMLSLIFITLFISLIKKQVNVYTIAISLLFSFPISLYLIMDENIHPLFEEYGVFFFLKYSSFGVNPQYTRIVLFLTLFSIFTILMFFRKYRNLDRSFVWLISFVSITVIMLFHMAIPMGMLRYAKIERLETFKTETVFQPIERVCEKYKCIKETEDYFKENDEDIYNAKPALKNAIKTLNDPSFKYSHYVGTTGDFIGTRYVFYNCFKNQGEATCIIDNDALKLYGKYSKLWFGFLTGIAHSIWFFFGMGLLFLHKKRKVKKIFNPTNLV